MKIYCSGIGGIGLSAYASLERVAGHEVMGSDRSQSALIEDLRSQGISVFHEQDGRHLPSDLDLFVYSEAIPHEAPERLRAAELGIPEKSYPEAVAALTVGKKLVAFCGTHGKSSTTAMAARMLLHTEKDPTVVVGTKLKELHGRNWRKGEGELFLLEACEYRRSFLQYHPSIILLTTCDGDHFDYFMSKEDYHNAYIEFLKKLPRDGVVITHMSDPDCAKVALASERTIVDADLLQEVHLRTPGKHMRENAKLVLGLADVLGIPLNEAVQALEGYEGSWRRIENRGTNALGVTVFDDYGHHPREIRATIDAVRESYPHRRLVCVFQPHTHDRTIKLWNEFMDAFRGVDLLLVSDVYDARSDIERERVDLHRFVREIADGSHTDVRAGGTLEETQHLLHSEILQRGDLLLCMGAGDVTNLATRMVED